MTETDVMDLCLCEFAKVVPQPRRLYRPVYMPGCQSCERLATSQTEGYGERSPTYEEWQAIDAGQREPVALARRDGIPQCGYATIIQKLPGAEKLPIGKDVLLYASHADTVPQAELLRNALEDIAGLANTKSLHDAKRLAEMAVAWFDSEYTK